jgi:hypothetical protein
MEAASKILETFININIFNAIFSHAEQRRFNG